MPEATVTIDQVFTKQGEHQGRQWTRYDIKPAEDSEDRYSTFSDSIGGKAQEYRGGKVTIVYEESERGKKITELRLNGPPPEGQAHVRAQENPATQRAIAASVALREAVATVTHQIPMDADTDQISAKVSPLARRYFLLLLELAGGEEVPF